MGGNIPKGDIADANKFCSSQWGLLLDVCESEVQNRCELNLMHTYYDEVSNFNL